MHTKGELFTEADLASPNAGTETWLNDHIAAMAAEDFDTSLAKWPRIFRVIVDSECRHEIIDAHSGRSRPNPWAILLLQLPKVMAPDEQSLYQFEADGHSLKNAGDFRRVLEEARAAANPSYEMTDGLRELAREAIASHDRGESDDWDADV